MITVIARLDPEDLERFRRADARLGALRYNPRAYDAETSERIVYEWTVLAGEIFERYGGEAYTDESWEISPSDGTLYYKDG